jgi:hypothetical protein
LYLDFSFPHYLIFGSFFFEGIWNYIGVLLLLLLKRQGEGEGREE